MSRSCVFLDRDGVINVKAAPGEYVRNWRQFEFLPNIVDWIRIFNTLDYLVIVITNQRGVARGLISPEDLAEIHCNMVGALASQGARIDDIFCCPHRENTCECRKPKPGMILQAQIKWDLNISRSLLIGDSDSDEELASNCGLKFIRAAHGRTLQTGLAVPRSNLECMEERSIPGSLPDLTAG